MAQLPQPTSLGYLRAHHLRPDLAAVLVCWPDPRSGDAARPRQQQVGARHLCLPAAGVAPLAAPLGVSVHGGVSLDFAVSVLPGWHATLFPPYFVAGANYSGFAMVAT